MENSEFQIIKSKVKIFNFFLFLTLFLNIISGDFCFGQEKDSLLVNGIMVRLLKTIEPQGVNNWPPEVKVIEDSSLKTETQMSYVAENNNYSFKIIITSGLLFNIFENDVNIVSFVISHEMAHILLGHFKSNRQNNRIISINLSHSDELEADMLGMKLAVDAGFKYSKILSGLKKIIKLGYDINSFDCINKEHPSWTERLAGLDSGQKKIWETLNAFKNGVSFLSLHKLDLAIHCFKYVINQFPGCYDAHANLGYCYLTKYIEGLDIEAIKELKTGYFINDAYYHNPVFIEEQVRGANSELWWEAVGELKFALKLNDRLTLAKANLGLAYLLNSSVSNFIGEAERYFSEAIEISAKDANINDLQRAIIYNNAGQLNFQSLSPKLKYVEYFNKVDENVRKFADFGYSSNNLDYSELRNAATFNKALLLTLNNTKKDLQKAVDTYIDFLTLSDHNSIWWDIAFENYTSLCDSLNILPKPKSEFEKQNSRSYKHVLSMKTSEDQMIILSGSTSELLTQLKDYQIKQSTVIPRKNLKKLKLEKLGVNIICSDYVFAVQLTKPMYPRIELESIEPRKSSKYLYVGMSKNELEKILRDEVFQENIIFYKPSDNLRYYSNIGVAVKFSNKTNKVEELIIAQLPVK